MTGYILGIDQSTQGTKAMLFNQNGKMLTRSTMSHRQLVNEKGWVSHDLEEIWEQTQKAVRDVVRKAGIDKSQIVTIGISNQRETSAAWERKSGKPVCDAIVWQCSRAAELCEKIEEKNSLWAWDLSQGNKNFREIVHEKTGLMLSPYFPAAKWAWIFENVPQVREKADKGDICLGTVDTYLIYKMTEGKTFATDYSNASRSMLFNIQTLEWDQDLLDVFDIPRQCMAVVMDSDAFYGETTLDGYFDHPVPIHAVMGDSHAALFGQDCRREGLVKATYGTGSSIMMNIGRTPVFSNKGLVTSLAWSVHGEVSYVLENNINYTGAVITWLKDDLTMITDPGETSEISRMANQEDTTYLVPAFSGLGAPHWDSRAKALLTGMTRTTGRNEIVKAAVESIAYQITEAVNLMRDSSGIEIRELRVDGGPTKNTYLMQFQSDLLHLPVCVPSAEELSGIGAAYAAGLGQGIYREDVFMNLHRSDYIPDMADDVRQQKMEGWEMAVNQTKLHG